MDYGSEAANQTRRQLWELAHEREGPTDRQEVCRDRGFELLEVSDPLDTLGIIRSGARRGQRSRHG